MQDLLPETILKAWESDTPGRLGGLIRMAGKDPANVFGSREVKDHEWIGWVVDLPGIGAGRIIRSIIHPLGKLMFDLEYDDPVSVVWLEGDGVYIPFQDRPERHETVHRYYGESLLTILSRMGGRAYKTD